jgi:glycosyltransferase involved in cell wall biosynthesis
LRVALIQDWLTEMGGAEKVFKEIHKLFPDADIFTLVYKEKTIQELGINKSKVFSSFIQHLPGCPGRYRSYLPLFKYAIEQFDLSEYDLIISSSYCVAKGVLTHNGQKHISYCHSPVRYAWDLHHHYLRQVGLTHGIKGLLAKYILHHLRTWDVMTSNRVDQFVTNSAFISKRIMKVYNRQSIVIFPPVNISSFCFNRQKEDFYFTCSRLVPYKKIDIIIQAFNEMPDKKLIVIGDGPEYKKLKKNAGPNIVMMGYQPFDVLKQKMQSAKAFVFAAEEDFGIVLIEAQASGTPVIAFGKGGVLETVVNKKTGFFFYEQTADSIKKTVFEFERDGDSIDYDFMQNHVLQFSSEIFSEKVRLLIGSLME